MNNFDNITAYTGTGSFFENTLAQNYLASELDLALSTLAIAPSPESFAAVNLVHVALTLYHRLTGTEQLRDAASVLQAMYDDGAFATPVENETQAEQLIAELDSRAVALTGSATADGDIARWFVENVIKNDRYTVDAKSAEAYEKILQAENPDAIGRTLTTAERNKLINDIKASGYAFCYIFLTDEQTEQIRPKYPAVVAKRINENSLMRAWAHDLQQYFTLDTIRNYLLSGFYEVVGKSPQQYVQEAINLGYLPDTKTVPQIGIAPAVIVAIIGLVSAIVTLIGQIVVASMSKPDNYKESVVPDDNDFHFTGTGTGTGTGAGNGANAGDGLSNLLSSSTMPLLIGGLVLIFLLKR